MESTLNYGVICLLRKLQKTQLDGKVTKLAVAYELLTNPLLLGAISNNLL
jgi:hypothetical protein